MGQLQGAALLIQVFLLVLAHAENLLVIIGQEAADQTPVVAVDALEFPAVVVQGHAGLILQPAPVLLEEHLALGVGEGENAVDVKGGGDIAVGDGGIGIILAGVHIGKAAETHCLVLKNGDFGIAVLHSLGQRPIVGGKGGVVG